MARGIEREGADLRLDASRPIEALNGHLPAYRGEQLAGFECDHWDTADIIESCPDIDFGRRWSRALAFRFGGDEFALWGAFAAATAYAPATGGVVFDSESGELLSPDQAIVIARACERSLPQVS